MFWHKWPVHDLELVILPPLLIKVAINTRPYSKLGGTTLNGAGGGVGRREVSIISHRPVTRNHLKQERSFFCGSVSTFLQLVVAVPFLAMGKKKLDENYARNDKLYQKLCELPGETPLDERGGECSSSLLGVYKISDFGLTFA